MRVDSHVHLQPHGERPVVDRERIERYVSCARANGVDAVALTEHLFRFREAYDLLGGWWESDPNPSLAAAAAAYWDDHVNLSLPEYVRLIEEAKADGLPVYLGLEMDWIPGRADDLRRLLAPYAWDVVLGSVHWVGAFLIDSSDYLDEWERRGADAIFAEYSALLGDLADSGLADVLAHSDLPKLFGHQPSSFQPLHDTIVAAATRGGCAIEINTAGLRVPAAEIYPAQPVLRRAYEAGIPITLASDAHFPERIGMSFDKAREWAQQAGYHEFSAYTGRKRVAHPF